MKVFDPVGKIKTIWNTIISGMAITAGIVLPYRIIFRHFEFTTFDAVISILFFIDILLNFNTGIQDKLNYITDRKYILRKYLHSWFIIDLVSAIPWVLIFKVFSLYFHPDTIVFKIFMLLRLLKLLRLVHVNKNLSVLQEKLLINPTLTRFSLFLLWLSMATHWMSLGWIKIGLVFEGTDLESYLRALYWCITTLTTIGYGDMTPDINSNLQVLYTMSVMILGAGMYGYLIGNVATILVNLDVAKTHYLEKMEQVSNFLRSKKIPSELQKKVINYYKYLWFTHKSIDTSSVISDLPKSLNTDISLCLNHDIIEKVPLFKYADEIFIREIIQRLEREIFLPNDYIIRQGEYGDCMYFISSGDVEVLVNNNKVATIGAGNFFGETALIKNEKRNASIKSINYCEVYVLSKKSLDILRSQYKDFNSSLEQLSYEREMDTKEKVEPTT